MQKPIWIMLIASGVLVVGAPGRALAQSNGLGPRILGPASPPFDPIQQLLYFRVASGEPIFSLWKVFLRRGVHAQYGRLPRGEQA